MRCARLAVHCSSLSHIAPGLSWPVSEPDWRDGMASVHHYQEPESIFTQYYEERCGDLEYPAINAEPRNSKTYDRDNSMSNNAASTPGSIASRVSRAVLAALQTRDGPSADIYKLVFLELRSKDCRSLLVEWADVMGKPRRKRYIKKPHWWPVTVAFNEPTRNSMRTVSALKNKTKQS